MPSLYNRVAGQSVEGVAGAALCFIKMYYAIAASN